MLAFPGLSYTEVMSMTYRERNRFWAVYKKYNK